MQDMIDHFLNELDRVDEPETPDTIAQGAVMALSRIVDETATLNDLHAYRTWLTKLRIVDGYSEADLSSGVAVAGTLARKLGVP